MSILFGQKSPLADFPEGYRPEEIGRRLAYNFAEKKQPDKGKWIGYPETCTWLGALRFAEATGDKKLVELLKKRFEILFTTKDSSKAIMNHVDWNMFGSLPLTIYQITKEKRYLDFGLPYADTQWTLPENAKPEERAWHERGYTWQTRLWIDDMYMITIVQTLAYKVTGQAKYLDRTAKEMVMYLDELQRPNGLFYHAPDVPFFWGRGNGWMAAGMSELLSNLPENHPDRPRIMDGYLRMMKSLKTYQRPSGMWNQLIDEPDCWAETSASAMFAYAFIVGLKHGWLDAGEYSAATRKAWTVLTHYIDAKGDISEVCVGTNKKNDKQYYYDRPRRTGDYHGQAPCLWCAAELIKN
ncbi:MAG: glycoside hydrolase family 88 protein [Prevotellaceae bacterium]|nr:glycoside hydrolase family 88 protein [Prevotellaceae bacterium]